MSKMHAQLLIVPLFILMTTPAKGWTKEQAATVTITSVQITEKIFMLSGKGGNIGLFIGEDGTFMIDDQFAPLTEKIMAAIKAVGGSRPRFLLNTHYHPDHTGVNENLGEESTLIFSHDNVRKRLHDGYFIKEFSAEQAPLDPEGLPVVTFSHEITFHLNGEKLRAVFTPNAHTDGDSFIIFSRANVIHTGDIFFNGFYPFIDVDHGGSLKGMIAAADTILALADDSTKIIPGHGPLGDKTQLQNYRDMLSTVLKRLSALKQAGKSIQEAIAAKPLAALEAEWGDGHFNGDQWIEFIYSRLP